MDDGAGLIWTDIFSADRVLNGDWVLIVPHLPDGFHRHGTQQEPITEDDLRTLVRNFERRATSGYYLSTIPFNKEHKESEGKIGQVDDVDLRLDGEPEEQGVYARLGLTEAGRALLEAGSFDYLSPEIRRRTLDTKTGENLGMSLAGLAATNYPFFGNRTAMYSSRAEERLGSFFSGMEQLLNTWRTMRAEVDEEESMEDDGPPSGSGDSEPHSDISHQQQREVRMEIDAERFEAMAEQVASLEARDAEREAEIARYRETIDGQNERLQIADREISRLAHARLADRFNHEVESFSALGADNGDFAGHLTWLYLSDAPNGDGQREHFDFFMELLRQADSALQDSTAFQESGRESGETATSPISAIERRMAELAAEDGIEVPRVGSEAYNDLMQRVWDADPELYASYRAGIVT